MRENREAIPTEDRIRRSAWVTVICDVMIIVTLVACLLFYISRNNIDIYNQNIENIQNIAKAEAELVRTALENTGNEIIGAYNYCDGKSVLEILNYLSIIDHSGGEYQLLKRDEALSTALYHVYNGYSTKKIDGVYQEIEYDDTSLAKSLYKHAHEKNGQISFSQSFTNKTDALRYFAVLCGISVTENGKTETYYLVKPNKESKLLDQLQMYSQYADLAMAICYTDGRYLACDANFRSDNFYDYLYSYNDLSIDERNAVKAAVQNDADGTGVLTYKDIKGRESAFAYSACGEYGDWNVIVSVPLSEFVTGELFTFFPLIITIFLAVLLIFNIWRLLIIVRALRQSVERERVANAAKSSFLSRMSHEIRTPLNAILGYNTLAQKEMADTESEQVRRQSEMKVMDCLSKSEIASKHLLTIINDVLDMSAIESGKVTIAHDAFDLRGVITSLTTVFYSQASQKGVGYEVLFGAITDEWLVGDQVRTNQILTNLLSNAIKFTPPGGSVTLRVDQSSAADGVSKLHFSVTDTGIGMTQEYLEHIWTPFEQADSSISRRFGGTGLGLSITKNLVELMGGTISVQSALGKGTTFDVELSFETAEPPQRNKASDFSAVNALIVNADSGTCNYIRLLFNRCGARCAAVTSGAGALQAVSVAKAQHDPFTVCLVDSQMPDMDGIETIRRIKDAVDGEMPIFVLSAYDYAEIADQASALGVSRFISKPIFQSSLFDMLTNIGGAQTPKKIEWERGVNFEGARILLAEDNAMNMEIAKQLLSLAGLTVDGAWNGREAVDMFTAAPPETYKAILMDVNMPEMDGYEATRRIRASSHPRAKTIPIIAMTADVFAENVAKCHEVGMDAHVGKPIDLPTLFKTLDEHIEQTAE